VRIANIGNMSDDDPSDDYQLPADTLSDSQQPDDALTNAATRRDLPAWESKISVSNAPFGVPTVVKMHSGGWSMTEMAPRIRKDAAQVEQPSELPNEETSEQPDAAHEEPIATPEEQPELGRRMLLH
jgi:hypothetical protein